MDARGERWLSTAVLVGFAYLLVGVGFAELARMGASREIRLFWRWAAWVVGILLLAVHFGSEVRRRRAPREAALHVATAVALGAFGLAAWINVHAHAASPRRTALAPLALIVFPIVTGGPAFVGAWAAAAVIDRSRRGGSPRA